MFGLHFDILSVTSWRLTWLYFITGLLCVFGALALWPYTRVHLVNGREGFEILWTNARKRYQARGKAILLAGFAKYKNAFYMVTDNGVEMVLSPSYVEEIRNNTKLNFNAYIQQASKFIHPKSGRINKDIIQTKLTPSLGRLIEPLSAEIADALRNGWGESEEWHEIPLLTTLIPVVAQEASKVFVGAPLCRNKDWQNILLNHTRSVQTALRSLRLWPYFLRPLVAKVLPACRRVSEEREQASRMIMPILAEKRAQNIARNQRGEDPVEASTYMEWLQESETHEFYDPVVAQLKISMASVHATSDLLTQTIFDICTNPDLKKDLLAEAIDVMKTYGWGKEGLHNLKLMDSALKETQRLKPMQTNLTRLALEHVKLSDGTDIPKGTNVLISCHNMWDSNVYDDADKYDGFRFYKLRQTAGQENSAQLALPSMEHLGFGLGVFACPGRHFAATMMKATLCHILLKYDFELVAGCTPQVIEHGSFLLANPMGRIAIRRRKEEIQL